MCVSREDVALYGFYPVLLRGGEFREVVRRSIGEWLRIYVEADSLLRLAKLHPFAAQREGSTEILAHGRGFSIVEVAVDEPHEASVFSRRLNGAGICFIFVERCGASCGHTQLDLMVLRLNIGLMRGPAVVSHTFTV